MVLERLWYDERDVDGFLRNYYQDRKELEEEIEAGLQKFFFFFFDETFYSKKFNHPLSYNLMFVPPTPHAARDRTL
jgi:hypothetical protein